MAMRERDIQYNRSTPNPLQFERFARAPRVSKIIFPEHQNWHNHRQVDAASFITDNALTHAGGIKKPRFSEALTKSSLF